MRLTSLALAAFVAVTVGACAQFTNDTAETGHRGGGQVIFREPGDKSLDLPAEDPTDLSFDFPDLATPQPPDKEPPAVVVPGDVLFLTDESELRPAAQRTLSEILRRLNEHAPDASLIVVGHTDSRGSEEHNQELSEARAESVRRWFEQHGMSSERLTARGEGESNLIVDDTDPDDRFDEDAGALNRRVEILIVREGQRPNG